MIVVLRWYFNERDGKSILPELSGVFGTFDDLEMAKEWIAEQSTWGGWGRYEYQPEELFKPES